MNSRAISANLLSCDAIAAKLSQLHEQDPVVKILPAHDRKAWRRAFGAPSTCLAQSPR